MKRHLAIWVAVLLCSAVSGAARAEFLDWSDVAWPAGTLGPRVYTGGDLQASTVTTTVLDPSGVRPSGFPQIGSGFNGFDHSLRLRADFTNTSQTITLRYVLGAPVSNVQFDIGDIDTGDPTSPYTGWQDILTITAFRGATEVPVTIVSRGSAVGFDASNSYSTGLNATIYGLSGDVAASSTAGNARIAVVGPVDQIRIDYRAGNAPDGVPGEGPSNPVEQGINFHDLIFAARADLSLSKVASTSTPAVGEAVTYTLTLANAGPAAATGVTVADVLPAGLSYVAGSIAGGSSRSASPPTLTWNVTTLASGASTDLTFQATVDAPGGAAGEYDNRAQVTVAPQPDPDSTPNNGTANGEDDTASAVVTPPFCAVTLVPDRTATIGAAQTVHLAHVLTNAGSAADVFDLAAAVAGSFTPAPIAWYRDLGTVGQFDPGVDVLLTDSDGDTLPDTGTLAPAASLPLLVAATGPNAAFSGSATVATTATTSLDPSCSGGVPASATATDTLSAGARVSGTVYADANHDATRNGGEAGTGLVLYAKLVPAATPAGPAAQLAAVDPASGAFAFPAVAAGSWILLYDTASAAADVSPTLPAGWLRSEEPDATRTFTVTSADVAAQDFGLFHGSRVEGLVFEDDGRGGGVAGNGLLDGAEAGIAGVALRAQAASCSGGVCDVDATDATGAFALWIPFAANGAAVQVTETDPAGYVSTGGSPGTTGGSYVIATDRVSFTNATGTVYTGLRFADFSGSSFAPDHQRAAMPGTAVFYPHRFTAGPSGTVRFSAAGAANPAIAGWAQSLFHDADCSGTLDAAEPQLQPADAIAVSAGGIVCVVLRETVPAGAPSGAQDLVIVTASFSAAGGATATLSASDLTTVGLPSGLLLQKSVDKASAEPGEVLVYTIAYRNDGAAPITQLVIADATPSWTSYVPASAACGPLPPLVSGCVPAPPAGPTGPVTWTFTGALAPGASGTVTYSVTIDPP